MLAILERASVSIRGQGVEGSMICPSSIRHRSLADIHEFRAAPVYSAVRTSKFDFRYSIFGRLRTHTQTILIVNSECYSDNQYICGNIV